MNDFLKNLRSGKDRERQRPSSRNQYHGQGQPTSNYYPYQDRRTGAERRYKKTEDDKTSDIKTVLNELMPSIRKLIDKVADNQVRVADAKERIADAEERKANTIQALAGPLKEFLTSSTAIGVKQQIMTGGVKDLQGVVEKPKKTPVEERKKVIRIIRTMRKKGTTYDQIADYLEKENIPTFSHKGQWHAQTIHRLCQDKK